MCASPTAVRGLPYSTEQPLPCKPEYLWGYTFALLGNMDLCHREAGAGEDVPGVSCGDLGPLGLDRRIRPRLQRPQATVLYHREQKGESRTLIMCVRRTL
jgi:hypothetical protein